MATQDICNFFYRGTELTCSVGDILSGSFDGICVSCDSSYTLNAGVGSSVRRAGESEFWRRLGQATHTGGVISVPTSGCGSLAAAHVILAPVRSTHRVCMNIVFSTIITHAKSLNLRTLAIPALGTGAYGLSFESAANFMKMALHSFSSFGSIQKIQFIDINAAAMNVFANAVNSIITLPMNGDDSDTSGSVSDSVFTAGYGGLTTTSSQILPSLVPPNGSTHYGATTVHPSVNNFYQPPPPLPYNNSVGMNNLVAVAPLPHSNPPPIPLIVPSRRTSARPTAASSSSISPNALGVVSVSTAQQATSSSASFADQSINAGTASSSVRQISTVSTTAKSPTLSDALDALKNGRSSHISLGGIFDAASGSATILSPTTVAQTIPSTSSAIANNHQQVYHLSNTISRSSPLRKHRKRHSSSAKTTRTTMRSSSESDDSTYGYDRRQTTPPSRVLPKFAKWSRTTAAAFRDLNNNARARYVRHNRSYVTNSAVPSTSASAAAAVRSSRSHNNAKNTVSDDEEDLSSYTSSSTHSSFIDDESLSEEDRSDVTYSPSRVFSSQLSEEDDDQESSNGDDSDVDDIDGSDENSDNEMEDSEGDSHEIDDMAVESHADGLSNLVNDEQLEEDDDDGTIYFNDNDNIVDIGSTPALSIALSEEGLDDNAVGSNDDDDIISIASYQQNVNGFFLGNQAITSHPTASSSHSMAFVGEHWTRVSGDEIRELRAEYVRNERERKEKQPTSSFAMKGDGTLEEEEEEVLLCSICLGEMLGSPGTQDVDYVVRLNVCQHLFHRNCIQMAFDVKRQCPLCMNWCSPAEGNQPIGSKMSVRVVPGKVDGHPNAQGFIEIRYEIPGGIQTAQHPHPGVPFYGTSRVAYLPNNPEGNTTLKLLQMAFDRRLIFTVGDSVTTGRRNVVVWNGIHHKTHKHGGPHNFAYPDPGYLRRVEEELANVGIRKDLLPHTSVHRHISS